MKSTTKKISLLLALCIALSMLLCACGGSSDDAVDVEEAIKGTWTLTTIVDSDGTEYTVEEYCASKGVDASGVEATYTFEDDGKGNVAVGGIPVEATYTVDGNTVNMTVNDQTSAMNFDSENNQLTYEDANTGTKSIFTK